MSISVGDIIVTSVETINVFDAVTFNHRFTLDELQNVSISQNEETTDLTGKQGKLLSRLKRNKTCTISATNGIVSNGLLELQTGGEFESGTQTVVVTEYLTISKPSSTATAELKYDPASGAAGIKTVYIKDGDGVATYLTYKGSATMATGMYDFTAATTGQNPAKAKLTFYASDVADGQECVVVYERSVTADYLKSSSAFENTSNKSAIYVDAIGENKCGKIYHIQFYFPKVDISGNFSFEMGDNQTVHSFEATALLGACGAKNTFWTYTIFGE